MSDEELKNILLTTDYISKTDREKVYNHVMGLRDSLDDLISLESVIEKLRVPAFPTLEHCFMFVSSLAKEEKCDVLQRLIIEMIRRIRDVAPLDEYMTDDDKELFKEFLDRAKNY